MSKLKTVEELIKELQKVDPKAQVAVVSRSEPCAITAVEARPSYKGVPLVVVVANYLF